MSEVANLKVSTSTAAHELRVEQGKGQRDRYVMLSPELLQLLREWWKAARPQVWLFPGQNPINPVTARQLNRAVTAAKDLAGISKRVSPIRCGTALRPPARQGVDIRVIQVLLGHAKLETTALYTRVAITRSATSRARWTAGRQPDEETRPPDHGRVARPPRGRRRLPRPRGGVAEGQPGHVSLAS